jgi:hypothetical protein
VDADSETLRARVSGLLGWERRKRREVTLTAALFYAFLAALAVPLFVSIPPGWAWAAPAALFVLLAPCLLLARRWREGDTTRAIAGLDRTLELGERATTAWELVQRNETKAVALLVLRQASERLKDVDTRKLFPRSWGWHVYALVPLVALWLGLHVFEARFQQAGLKSTPPSLAQEARELARRVQEKARSESLPRTLEAGRELEKIAQQGIDASKTDEQLRSELAGVGRKLAAERTATGQAPPGAAESRRQLEDLKAELEAARELLAETGSEGESVEDRLGALSELKKQLERQDGARRLSRDEMKAFVDKLDRRVSAELDRRALADTERSVQQLAQRGKRIPGDPGSGRDSDKETAEESGREREAASASGNEPGKDSGRDPLAGLSPSRRSQVKGTINEGPRSGIYFKATPVPGKSGISPDEVVASYRRQAEAELDTERIPGELKETIRNYFLLLDKTK